jgi:formate dehydrogenase subunit gamma
MRLIVSIRMIMLAMAVAIGAFAASPALAQGQQVNPTANAVKEEQLLNALKPGGQQEIGGRISIPDGKAATLIRPAGRDWREFHQGTLPLIGAVSILGMLALLALFYMKRGKIMVEKGLSGQTITRFGSFDRFVHWLTAGCFIVLALSGLNITFGKSLLLPVIGPEAFTALSTGAKFAHNYLAWPFMLGLVFMLLIWIKDNIPSGTDVAWFKAGGGLIGKGHPPAKRFNGGQKMIFWSVILGGAALSVSGFYLLFPYQAGGVLNLQFWNVIHAVVSLVLIAVMLAHAYIGSIGMQGAFDAMGTGEVDLNWAKEHHSLWAADEMKKGRAGAGGGKLQPAE